MGKYRNKKRAKLKKLEKELENLLTLSYYHQPEDVAIKIDEIEKLKQRI